MSNMVVLLSTVVICSILVPPTLVCIPTEREQFDREAGECNSDTAHHNLPGADKKHPGTLILKIIPKAGCRPGLSHVEGDLQVVQGMRVTDTMVLPLHIRGS